MPPRLLQGVMVCWMVSLPLLTFQQTHVWTSEKALWANAVKFSPLKPRPHINLGRAFELDHDQANAEDQYLLTISLSYDERRPGWSQRFARAAAETNIAHLEMTHGLNASAMRILDQVIAEWPEFPYAQYNRAVILSAVGVCPEAMHAYQMARQFKDLTFPVTFDCREQP